jgi:hypothetical protein
VAGGISGEKAVTQQGPLACLLFKQFVEYLYKSMGYAGHTELVKTYAQDCPVRGGISVRL